MSTPVSEHTSTALVRCSNVVRVYGEAGAETVALRGVDLDVAQGETLAVLGPSGAGKSTLLWLLAGLIEPTAGQLFVAGNLVGGLGNGARASLRARTVGVLLQNPSRNLMSYASAVDNVLFAQRPTRRRPSVKRRRAHDLLEAVGLADVGHARAGTLSGGEQQRLALAVALANGPALLLADEPTSQLDVDSAGTVVDLIRAANADLGTTVIVVTHDPSVAKAMNRTVSIRDGRVGAEGRAGREYAVIGRDGGLHLPADVLDVLPPGTLVRVERREDGVELHAVDPNEEEDLP